MANVPKIRFQGFTGAWEQRKLTDFVDFFSGLTYTPSDVRDSGTLVLRSSNVSNGEIVDADNVFVDSAVVNVDNVREGDIIVVVRNGSCSLIGKHAQIKGFMPHTVIGAFMTGIRSQCPAFTNALLNTPHFDEEVAMNMGATINQITGYMFSKMEFTIPNIDEQKQIGLYFENLDNLITLHQRKLDGLQKFKKAMLQKMFPKAGSSQPEIRFQGFTGAWEQRKLGDITDSYSGGTPSVGVKEYYGGDIPFIRSAEINSSRTELFITQEGLTNSSARMANIGDILYALYGATSGEVGCARLKGAVNQAILVIQPHSEYYPEFLMQWLRKSKQTIVDTYLQGGQGNLSGTIVKELIIDCPSTEEQTIIGTYFRNLDDLITLHQRKLDGLQKFKKAMLQKMFV
ncbi:MAG: restriction endonuclease subunit S [Oscillospiraceae bacterium]|nr:restriction endonuclease subunit S [Oscillospiraceae bacterium]